MILVENEHLQSIAQRLLAETQVSFENMNSIVAENLTALLQPTTSDSGHRTFDPLGTHGLHYQLYPFKQVFLICLYAIVCYVYLS